MPLILLGLSMIGLTAAIVATVVLTASTAVGARMTVDEYQDVTGSLPDAGSVFTQTFQTTRIYDRDGNLLQDVDDPNGYWRTFVGYDQISPDLVNATIAAEDATFWTHEGVEPLAIVRGAFIIFTGAGSSGGSTITQQLARALFPEEIGYDYSVFRKVREAFAAYDLTQKYPKVDILTMYLNQIFYGQRSYGIEAASVMYFDKHASELNLAEASLLAGIPQLPTAYNPALHFDLAKQRQQYVLDQMVKLGYITRAEADAAWAQTLTIRGDRSGQVLDNPHFTQYVRDVVTERYGEDALYRGGLQIYTSIDSELQESAEEIVQNRVAEAAPYSISNGAAVIASPATGEILAMVGSADFDNPLIAGQVNITTSPQQPGSTMKPIAYLAAFEQMHWNPGTTLLDVPFERETASGPYQPGNFTGSFYGALTVRTALANSLNIPALKAAENVGESGVIEMARRLGMKTSFDDNTDYGLQVALGGGEVQMVELVNAYATIANEGRYVPFSPITRIEDAQGNVLYELDPTTSLQNAAQVVQPEYAYQIIDILSDNQARQMLFGQGNIAETTQQTMGRQMATKSGTTNDVRDQLRMGFTTAIVVGVWTGNTDNTPMQPTPGNIGTDAMWSDLMLLVHEDLRFKDLLQDGNGAPYPDNFARPDGIYEGPVCANTSHNPGNGDATRTELLARGNEPVLLCDQMTAWEQRDLDEALGTLNDPRLVGGAANSVRAYAAEITGQRGVSNQVINSTGPSQPGSDGNNPDSNQNNGSDQGTQGNTQGNTGENADGQPSSQPSIVPVSG
jgi:penicillin-binding protein 1C